MTEIAPIQRADIPKRTEDAHNLLDLDHRRHRASRDCPMLRAEALPLPAAVKEAVIRLAEALARVAARMDHDRTDAGRKP